MVYQQSYTERGTVASIAVSGWGPNSAELVVVLTIDGVETAFAIESGGGGTEPQVFAVMATMLTSAFQHRTEVQVTVVERLPGQTPGISAIQIPPR